MNKKNIKTVLLGYDRKTVDLFLKGLYRLQGEEIQTIQDRISKANKEQDSLLQEISQLQLSLKESESSIQPHGPHVPKQDESVTVDSAVPGKAIDFFDAAAKRGRRFVAKVDQQQIQFAGSGPAEVQIEETKKEKSVTTRNDTVEGTEPLRYKESAATTDSNKGYGFWNEIESFLVPIDKEVVMPAHEETAATLALPESLRIEPDNEQRPTVRERISPELGKQEIEAESESNVHSDQGSSSKEEESPEIDSLKLQYIVGKLAGEDLLDRTGHVIISKQMCITEPVIRAAEREGKLVELIVNMIIPGLED